MSLHLSTLHFVSFASILIEFHLVFYLLPIPIIEYFNCSMCELFQNSCISGGFLVSYLSILSLFLVFY